MKKLFLIVVFLICLSFLFKACPSCNPNKHGNGDVDYVREIRKLKKNHVIKNYLDSINKESKK